MKVIDQTAMHVKYRGKWVALKHDRLTVLAAGKTAKEAWSKARKKGYERPVISFMTKSLPLF